MKNSNKGTFQSSLFTSSRERLLWVAALMVLAALFSSLFFGRPFVNLLQNQNIQAGIFLFGMLAVGVMILLYGVITKPKILEWVLLLGIVTTYALLFLRLGLPERSHLIEYSTLSLIVHQAFLERQKQGKNIPFLNAWVLLLTCSIGVLDECIQLFLPNRVFDTNDIIFNCLTILMAIGVSSGFRWLRNRLG